MAEQLDLTTPITAPSLTNWRVERIVLDKGQTVGLAEVVISLRGTNGELLVYRYAGDVARTLVQQLNTVNLSVQSLERRVLNRLIADGVLSGAVSGSPD